jgi:hypothetical protein
LENNPVEPSDIQDDVTYKYVVTFAYKDPVLAESIILSNESDNFIRQTVKTYDPSTGDYTRDFVADNIRIIGSKVTVTGINTDIFKLAGVDFFDAEGNKVDAANVELGVAYTYRVDLDYKDESLNKSNVILNPTGEVTFVRVACYDSSTQGYTKTFDGEYLAFHSAPHPTTQKTLSVSGYQSYDYLVESVEIYDGETLVEPEDVALDTEYTYNVCFYVRSSISRKKTSVVGESGSFVRKRVLFQDGSSEYTKPMDGGDFVGYNPAGYDNSKYKVSLDYYDSKNEKVSSSVVLDRGYGLDYTYVATFTFRPDYAQAHPEEVQHTALTVEVGTFTYHEVVNP